ncbi:MAG: flagellar motor switch protein FliG [Pseudomonadota bacterium]
MPLEKPEDIGGVERAAIFLLSIGEDEASEIMKHLSQREVQVLGARMSTLKGVTRDIVDGSITNFVNEIQDKTSVGVGGDDYLRSVLIKALGEEKAENVIDRILLNGTGQGIEALKWMDARSVAEIVRYEHPQIISLVLSFLHSGQAADVLNLLPENQRTDIMMRIATLDAIPPAAIRELDQILEQHATSEMNVESAKLGGVKTVAEILNNIGPNSETVMEQLKEEDEDLSVQISDLMFVFDDLVEVDDRGIQSLLREVSTDHLTLALKGVSEDLKNKVLKNMSSRAAEMLAEDMDAKGPVRLSEVEEAQKEILIVARRLEAEGTIMLGGGGEEFV